MDGLDLALTILRVWVGIVMLAHGVKHALGREKTVDWLASIGYKQPKLQWLSMSASEVGAGVLLIAGLLTSLAFAATAAIMVVAYLTVHHKAGFWVTARPDEGWEYVATVLAVCLAGGILGPGEWSVDAAIDLAENLDGWVGLVIVGGGAVAGGFQVATFFRPGEVAD
jgi:putative oxidoreductase